MRVTAAGDMLRSLSGSGEIKPMPEAQIAKAVQLLDLMLEFFADDGHWTRGCYDDGNGGHCLVGTLLHLSRKHRLPTATAIALLQDAMPRPGLPLVHFNDTRCGSVAELRSVIVKARRLAIELKHALALHIRIEHFQGAAAGVDSSSWVRSGNTPRTRSRSSFQRPRRIFTLPTRHCELNGPNRVVLSPLSAAGTA